MLNNFKETLTFENGRYVASLPWKDQPITVEENHNQAKNRLYSLERKLLQDPVKAKSYREAINKYVDDGIAEEVPSDEIVPSQSSCLLLTTSCRS